MPFDKGRGKEKFLTADELIERWNGAVSKGTLANWRSQGKGPDFVKPFGRVQYLLSSVIAWEKENMGGTQPDDNQSNESDTR